MYIANLSKCLHNNFRLSEQACDFEELRKVDLKTEGCIILIFVGKQVFLTMLKETVLECTGSLKMLYLS